MKAMITMIAWWFYPQYSQGGFAELSEDATLNGEPARGGLQCFALVSRNWTFSKGKTLFALDHAKSSFSIWFRCSGGGWCDYLHAMVPRCFLGTALPKQDNYAIAMNKLILNFDADSWIKAVPTRDRRNCRTCLQRKSSCLNSNLPEGKTQMNIYIPIHRNTIELLLPHGSIS